jgi:histidine ammonia-lyase
MGTISARKARTIIEHVQAVLGIEWMCASQAINLQDSLQLGRGTLKAYELLRKHVTFMEEDRVFYQDQKKAASLIADGSLVEMIESTLGRLE